MDNQRPLPYVCPDHPAAQILHEWNRTQYIQAHGYPMGIPLDSGHQYFCSKCKRELAPPMGE